VNQRVLRFERLVVPQNIHRGLQHPAHLGHPLLLDWWRARAASVQRRRASSTCRLYLPRVGKRSVLNETEVVELLDRHGFLCVDPSTLSFVEQMSLFATASAIVSPHGAALTNLLFAPSSCRVLEMFGPTGGTPAFMVLAKALGQDYTAFVSGDAFASPTTDFDDAPIEMDLGALEQWLAKLPQSRKRTAETALPASR
jgi:capsular polysaccharide biosynthesis protein